MLEKLFDSPARIRTLRDNPLGEAFDSFSQELCEYGDSLPISTSTSGTALPSPTLTRKLGGNGHP